jgi:hypothetical protein
MPHRFIYVVDAHFIDKIEEKKSWTQVPVFLMSYFLISMEMIHTPTSGRSEI